VQFSSSLHSGEGAGVCRSASRLAINCDVNCSFHKAQTSLSRLLRQTLRFPPYLKGTNPVHVVVRSRINSHFTHMSSKRGWSRPLSRRPCRCPRRQLSKRVPHPLAGSNRGDSDEVLSKRMATGGKSQAVVLLTQQLKGERTAEGCAGKRRRSARGPQPVNARSDRLPRLLHARRAQQTACGGLLCRSR